MQNLIYLFSPYFGYVLMFLFIGMLIPRKYSNRRMAVYLLPMLFSHVPKYIWGAELAWVNLLTFAIVMASCVGFACWFFAGHRRKAIAYALFFYALQMLADSICFVVFSVWWKVSLETMLFLPVLAYFLLTWGFYAIISLLCIRIIRTVSMQKFNMFYLLFLIFRSLHRLLRAIFLQAYA